MIEPLRDRVLLRKLEATQGKTASGLVLPGTATDNLEAEVLAVGTGAVLMDGKNCTMVVQVGDRVLLPGSVSKLSVRVEGEELFLVRESDISAVLVRRR